MSRARKLALVLLVLLAATAVTVVLVDSEDADPTEEAELAWLRTYAAWFEGVEDALADGSLRRVRACADTLDRQVATPPDPALTRIVAAARRGCRALRAALVAGSIENIASGGLGAWDWERAQAVSALVEVEGERAGAESVASLASVSSRIAEGDVDVRCWPPGTWRRFRVRWRILDDRPELWIIGFADPVQGRAHLSPDVCGPLKRFFGSSFTPHVDRPSYDLAVALVTLAHEAEHLRDFSASEAEVECFAVQHVREIVEATGRDDDEADRLASIAWEVAYPANLPEYRTPDCHDGGPLDLHSSPEWP